MNWVILVDNQNDLLISLNEMVKIQCIGMASHSVLRCSLYSIPRRGTRKVKFYFSERRSFLKHVSTTRSIGQ